MSKYIDADRLRAEIEKNTPDTLQLLAYRDIILALIDSLQQEQPDDNKLKDFTIYHPLKNGSGKYECIPYSFKETLTSFSDHCDLMEFIKGSFLTEVMCLAKCRLWNDEEDSQPEEQPEVDLEKEIEEHVIYMPHGEFASDNERQEDVEWARKEFHHFYERGKNSK